ncbi:MAG: hypothetical protein QF682_07325 [Candidatus Thermoplasmatota archaeon]|nr:hypothetical protein [Candidatus Thermoplasmatota archaeon]
MTATVGGEGEGEAVSCFVSMETCFRETQRSDRSASAEDETHR